MKLMSIAGARPNFMKLAAISWAVEDYNREQSDKEKCIQHIIVHTGQHYDKKMSESFFEELSIPEPDINLEVGSGTHAVQTAEIMKRFEPVLLKEQPDVLLVVGDVNSTIACTLVASKIDYGEGSERTRPIIVHVEAGLRSFDPDMPEEINRILTDALSDMLFVTEESGVANLRNAGVESNKVHMVGNVMIDTLQRHLQQAKSSTVRQRYEMPDSYGIVTLHRPSNVDSPEKLEPLLSALYEISKEIELFFPIHPRTLKQITAFGLEHLIDWSRYPEEEGRSRITLNNNNNSRIYIIPPLGYLDFMGLVESASLVVTDSGGIQEETTFLQVPCMTLRQNTERPVTVTVGSNYLVGTDPVKITTLAKEILDGKVKQATVPEKWDGKAGSRIVDLICGKFYSESTTYGCKREKN